MTAPIPRFTNDDEAAQHWLILLRDGDADQKLTAREQLAAIFERRGMLEEATDLLESNVRDGVRNADIFRWLARLYRNGGDEVRAMQAAAEAAKYIRQAEPAPTMAMAPPASHVEPQRQGQPPLPPMAPRRKARPLQTLAIGVGAVLLSLCACGTLISLVSTGASQPTAKPTSIVVSAPPEKPVAAEKPTATPRPPTATPVPPTPLPAIGQTVSTRNWEYTVTKVERKKSFTWTNFGNTREAKGEWALIQARLKNIGNQTYPIHTWDFEVHDEAGTIYKPDISASSSYASALNMSNLGGDFPPGVETNVAFATDINPAAHGLRLKVTQGNNLFIRLEP